MVTDVSDDLAAPNFCLFLDCIDPDDDSSRPLSGVGT
jgi:hypothetical protein